MTRTVILALVAYSALLYSGTASAEPQNATVAGYLEKARVGKKSLTMKAKLDTGADNSSINAAEIDIYRKSGKEWARFKVTNFNDRTVTINRPIIKYTRIKKKDGGIQRRPVIELKICIAGVEKTVPVNLANRKRFRYQLLIGRSYLRPDFLIDSGKTFTVEPNCR